MVKQTLGQILLVARQESGLSINTLSDQTKIKPEYLQALEQDHYEIFSSDVHIKGFIKLYAKALRLDYEKLLAVYRRDIASTFSPAQSTKRRQLQLGAFANRYKWFLAGAGVLSLAAFAGLVVAMNVLKPPVWKLTAPLEINAPFVGEIIVNSNTIVISGELTDKGILRLNGNILPQNNPETFTTDPLPVNVGANLFIISVTNQLGRASEVRLTVNRPQPEVLPAPQMENPEEESLPAP